MGEWIALDIQPNTVDIHLWSLQQQHNLCIITMDKRQTDGKSTTLEKACFVKGLQYLLGKHANIVEIVTDAHAQIESYMSKY
jgi:hypothetical protein